MTHTAVIDALRRQMEHAKQRHRLTRSSPVNWYPLAASADPSKPGFAWIAQALRTVEREVEGCLFAEATPGDLCRRERHGG